MVGRRTGHEMVDERDRNVDDTLNGFLGRRQLIETPPKAGETVSEQRVEERLLGRVIVRERLLADADGAGHLSHAQRRDALASHLSPSRVEDLPFSASPSDGHSDLTICH